MCDINQIINTKIFELKIKKDKYINEKAAATNKITRIENNIRQMTFKYHGEIAKLKNFFPTIDEEKLKKIEAFHLGISQILLAELEHSRSKLAWVFDVDCGIHFPSSSPMGAPIR